MPKPAPDPALATPAATPAPTRRARAVLKFEQTPNPNALKCVLAKPLAPAGAPTRAFRTQDSAAGDPLAARLMGIKGVVGVLIAADWLTVNRAPDAPWPAIKSAVEEALGHTP